MELVHRITTPSMIFASNYSLKHVHKSKFLKKITWDYSFIFLSKIKLRKVRQAHA